MRLSFLFANAVLLVLAFEGPYAPPRADAADVRKVVAGQVSATATSWPGIIAKKKGLWSANGIEVETVQIGVSEGMQALTSGSLNLMHNPCNTVINFMERGGKNVRIGIVSVAPHPGVLIGRKGLTNAAELRGKSIGVSSVSSGSTILVRRLLAARGLKDSEYDVIGAQGTAEMFKGLQAGVFDAVWLIPPQSISAAKAGFPVLGTFREVAPKFDFACFAANADWLDRDPVGARAFGKAWIDAVRWLYEPANRSEAEQYLAEEMKLSTDIVKATYDEMVLNHADIYPRDGRADPDALRAVVDIMVEGKELAAKPNTDVRDYVDDRMLR